MQARRRISVLNARHKIAQTVASELIPAEHEVDQAIVRNARLAIAVVEGRKALRLPLTAGQEGLALVTQATATLAQARGYLAQAHIAFRKTQAELGLDAFSYGDLGDCPPSTAQVAAPLRSVA